MNGIMTGLSGGRTTVAVTVDIIPFLIHWNGAKDGVT